MLHVRWRNADDNRVNNQIVFLHEYKRWAKCMDLPFFLYQGPIDSFHLIDYTSYAMWWIDAPPMPFFSHRPEHLRSSTLSYGIGHQVLVMANHHPTSNFEEGYSLSWLWIWPSGWSSLSNGHVQSWCITWWFYWFFIVHNEAVRIHLLKKKICWCVRARSIIPSDSHKK